VSYRVELVTDRRSWRDFQRLPFVVYRDDPRWVAPLCADERRTLDARRNPYFGAASLRLFVCYHGERPVARLSLVVDQRHRAPGGGVRALFGFFECVHDEEAAGRLVEAMLAECHAAGVAVVEGPFDPNHYSPLGLQTSRFDVGPAFFETYNPPYYADLLERLGFTVAKRLHTRRNDRVADYIRRRYGRVTVRDGGGFSARHADAHDAAAELERIRRVFNDAFADNWRFLPVSCEEYAFSAKGLFHITRPDLITLVEHDGEPVGALLCVLDVNPQLRRLRGRVGPVGALRFLWQRRSVRDLIVYAVGVKRAYRSTQAFRLLLEAACATAVRYQTLATTWMSHDNAPAVRAAERLGLEPYKEFAVYQKHLPEVRHA
jgi:hypothetical protein